MGTTFLPQNRFWAIAGKKGITFLPQNRNWGNCGQKGDLFFTAKSFFGQLRAKRGPLFYQQNRFLDFDG
jgi:hypothetical protein